MCIDINYKAREAENVLPYVRHVRWQDARLDRLFAFRRIKKVSYQLFGVNRALDLRVGQNRRQIPSTRKSAWVST